MVCWCPNPDPRRRREVADARELVMAKRLNVFTHVQQQETMNELARRCPQLGSHAWTVAPKVEPRVVVRPRKQIAIGVPEPQEQAETVRIVLVA